MGIGSICGSLSAAKVWYFLQASFNTYRSGNNSHLNRSEGKWGWGAKLGSAPVTDRHKIFSGGAFLEKIIFSTYSSQTAPKPLFSGQPQNIKTAIERPILS